MHWSIAQTHRTIFLLPIFPFDNPPTRVVQVDRKAELGLFP